MAFFFKEFPTTEYDLFYKNRPTVLTNIMVRFKVREILNSRSVVYYNYNVKDGERPDIIAHKYYDDATLDWIILLTNNVINPFFEWPLDLNSLNKFVSKKYGSVSNAQGTVHHYEKIIQQRSRQIDGNIIDEKALYVDEETYNTLDPQDRRIVDNYQFEIERNEQRRNIKILDRRFMPSIVNQVETIFD